MEKRVQFSSCDKCRRARVACDARRHANGSCTRCRRRQLRCTFQWIEDVKGTPMRASERQSPSSPSQSSQNETSDPRSQLPVIPDNQGSSAEPLSLIDTHWLLVIYEQCFEAIFGSWLSQYGCPFVFRQHKTEDVGVSVSQLCRQLDEWIQADDEPDHENDRLVEQSLSSAIQTFAMRWLPLVLPSMSVTCSADLVRTIWRRGRRDMLRVINRPSYRSILSLLLFGLTPVPVGISMDEEMDGISGQVCVQAALQFVQALRARQRSLRFNGYKVSPILVPRALSPRDADMATHLINTENTLYWATLTFDTSATLTFGSRPTLSAGLFGIESESSWRLVKACRMLFQNATSEWHQPEFVLTDAKANEVIATGSMWKLLVWKMTAVFKEALADGHDEAEVIKALSAAVLALEEWNESFRPWLTACHKRIHFFSQNTKFRWYELMLHYHLAILLLVDIVEATERMDLLPRLTPHRDEAESWLFNCLDFGLNNSFTLVLPSLPDLHIDDDTNSITIPIVALDPYAHHVVAAVQLLRKAIGRELAVEKITLDTYATLYKTLTRTLDHLPRCSKSVQAAREEVLSAYSPG